MRRSLFLPLLLLASCESLWTSFLHSQPCGAGAATCPSGQLCNQQTGTCGVTDGGSTAPPDMLTCSLSSNPCSSSQVCNLISSACRLPDSSSPVISSSTPAHGRRLSAPQITVVGTGFGSHPSVFVGGQLCTNQTITVTANSPANTTTITCAVPSLSDCRWQPVSVLNGDNQQLGTKQSAFSYLKTQANGFEVPTAYAAVANPIRIVSGDLDHDGKIDLVVASNLAITTLLGSGNGTFVQPAGAPELNLLPGDMLAADLPGNGQPVRVTCSSSLTNVTVASYGPGGGIASTQSGLSGILAPDVMVAGDVDGDGKSEVIVASSMNTGLSVLGNLDTKSFTSKVGSIGGKVGGMALADVNGDKVLDLIATYAEMGKVDVLLGNGDRTFKSKTPYMTGMLPAGVAVGDAKHTDKFCLHAPPKGCGFPTEQETAYARPQPVQRFRSDSYFLFL